MKWLFPMRNVGGERETMDGGRKGERRVGDGKVLLLLLRL